MSMANLTYNATTNLLLAVPKFAIRARSLAISFLPDHVDSFLTKYIGSGSFIALPTTTLDLPPPSTSTIYTTTYTSVSSSNNTLLTRTGRASEVSDLISLPSLISIGQMFSFVNYLISKWAIATLVIAFVLNRTRVYAAVQRPLRLNFLTRAALYCIPISLLAVQLTTLVRAIKCQGSPDWSLMRYGNASKNFELDYAGDGGYMYKAASTLIPWESDPWSCNLIQIGAVPPGEKLFGSLSLLWPLFLSFCTSSFVETISATMQGVQPIVEMSLFELSVAYHDAEAMVLRPFRINALNKNSTLESLVPFKVNSIQRVMNVPQEVLLAAIIAVCFSISCNILAIFNKRKRWQLINTTIWGTANIIASIIGIYRMLAEDDSETWTLRLPAMFIVGFVPHILIILGIFACASIYGIALVIMVIAGPSSPDSSTIRERFVTAYTNLQANFYLQTGQSIRFSWEDDFYSALLKIGFSILSCASGAVYLNELTQTQASKMTWLEKERWSSLQNSSTYLQKRTLDTVPNQIKDHSQTGHLIEGLKDDNTVFRSGYAIERKPQQTNGMQSVKDFNHVGADVGQHRGRWRLVIRFFTGLFYLSVAASLQTTFGFLAFLGIKWRPTWVDKLIGPLSTPTQSSQNSNFRHSKELSDFFHLNDMGQLRRSRDLNLDVEYELRRQANRGFIKPELLSDNFETDIDNRLYNWWKLGGFWGEEDSSGDYSSSTNIDDDLTSVISSPPEIGEADWQTDSSFSSGQVTPTRLNPHSINHASSSSYTSDLLDPQHLSSLLDPHTPAQYIEARMLARRLRTPGVTTRAQYERDMRREKAAVLMTGAVSVQVGKAGKKDEWEAVQRMREEDDLEDLIWERRKIRLAGLTETTTDEQTSSHKANQPAKSDWASGAPGLGSFGPVCVVCHDSPRTILLWPCGCLALCDDCRLSMAVRGYDKCICCRRGTGGFSRLFVP